jgi:two-component sensor histidine kinase
LRFRTGIVMMNDGGPQVGAACTAGRVELGWSASAGEFRLHWREHRAGATSSPRPGGFGMSLIRRSVAHDLGGNAECRFTDEGVAWWLAFPVPAGHAPAGTDAR